ncbi:MAG: sensor histidine kinase [Anaerostipes hadrus]
MRLSQVIINFISNALKFTPEHGEITVTFRQMGIIDDKAHLMLRVKDTGKGMKTGFLDKIFLPFEQEDASTAHNYGGSGLGMAIADNIIKLMHGEILVESEEGKGSEFVVYVSLPVAQENIDDLKNSASTASQTSYLEDQTSSNKILQWKDCIFYWLKITISMPKLPLNC